MTLNLKKKKTLFEGRKGGGVVSRSVGNQNRCDKEIKIGRQPEIPILYVKDNIVEAWVFLNLFFFLSSSNQTGKNCRACTKGKLLLKRHMAVILASATDKKRGG